MADVLTRLFQQVEPEHTEPKQIVEQIAQLETSELADAFLIALQHCEGIYPSQIINAEAVLLELGYDSRTYPSSPSPISDSDGDTLLIALMAAWQWLIREIYLVPRPDHLFSSTLAGPGEKPYFITQRGRNRIAELVKMSVSSDNHNLIKER